MSSERKLEDKIERSVIITLFGIILLFSTSILVILLFPLSRIDPSWTEPVNPYQVQVYEVADPNLYISSATVSGGLTDKQFVYHLREGFTLLALQENELLHILAPPELEKYVTRLNEKTLKLTSRLLMLRIPQENTPLAKQSANLQTELQQQWEKDHPKADEEGLFKPSFSILELYEVQGKSAFAVAPADSILENWVSSNFTILDETVKQAFHQDPGVIYVKNPQEYRVRFYKTDRGQEWRFDPKGDKIASLTELQSHALAFKSRQEFIHAGEQVYKVEGCWYCHTDQTRTLVQDVVLNGGAAYPAPPSVANEYIYQYVTFPGTRRIGPDLSRTGVKRPSRDWHRGHFWSPKTASRGTIMPAFKHFFDQDPSGTSTILPGIPNFQFEAIYQYLMTKGTRINPPNEAWWLGKDPVQTKEIIEGLRKLP